MSVVPKCALGIAMDPRQLPRKYISVMSTLKLTFLLKEKHFVKIIVNFFNWQYVYSA
jgi:hypothetical protein